MNESVLCVPGEDGAQKARCGGLWGGGVGGLLVGC